HIVENGFQLMFDDQKMAWGTSQSYDSDNFVFKAIVWEKIEDIFEGSGYGCLENGGGDDHDVGFHDGAGYETRIPLIGLVIPSITEFNLIIRQIQQGGMVIGIPLSYKVFNEIQCNPGGIPKLGPCQTYYFHTRFLHFYDSNGIYYNFVGNIDILTDFIKCPES